MPEVYAGIFFKNYIVTTVKKAANYANKVTHLFIGTYQAKPGKIRPILAETQ